MSLLCLLCYNMDQVAQECMISRVAFIDSGWIVNHLEVETMHFVRRNQHRDIFCQRWMFLIDFWNKNLPICKFAKQNLFKKRRENIEQGVEFGLGNPLILGMTLKDNDSPPYVSYLNDF